MHAAVPFFDHRVHTALLIEFSVNFFVSLLLKKIKPNMNNALCSGHRYAQNYYFTLITNTNPYFYSIIYV